MPRPRPCSWVTIVRETLQLATKTVADAMTPLHRVRMLPHDTAGCC